MWGSRSIFRALMMLLAGSLFLATALSALLNYVLVRNLIDDQVQHVQLPAALREVRNAVDGELSRPVQTARQMAANSFMREFLLSGEPAAQQAVLTDYLNAVKKDVGASMMFLVTGGSGSYYLETGLFKKISADVDRDRWYFDFVAANREIDFNFDLAEKTNEPTLYVNQALRHDGRIIAVTGVAQSLKGLADLIARYRLGESGHAFVVNADGMIMLHPDSALMGKRKLAELPGFAEASALNRGAEVQVISVELDSGAAFAGSVPLSIAGWRLIAVQPKSELYAGLNSVTWKSVLTVSVVAFILVAVGLLVLRKLFRPVQEVARTLASIGEHGGDLRVRLEMSAEQETAQLANGFNQFTEKLAAIVRDVATDAEKLHDTTARLATQVQETAQYADTQQQRTEQVATAVHEMGLTVQEIAGNATKAATAAKAASHSAGSGQTTINASVQAIERLSSELAAAGDSVRQLAEGVSSIGSVLDVIRGVAEQTNLLALNAAIEAARAGEQGRGFAVVADEVRHLAQRTQDATRDIQQKISDLQSGAMHAVEAMDRGQQSMQGSVASVQQAGAAFASIAGAVEDISGMNFQIATATEEQSTVTSDMDRNLVEIADLSRRTRGISADCRAACDQLAELARHLNGLIHTFRY